MTTLTHRLGSLLFRPEQQVGWLAPLLGRLALGLLFLSTGWGKVHSLDQVQGFFTSLGIPLPGFNAHLVAFSELICGGLLIVGLLTRLATIPLMITMCVALLTARSDDVHGLFDLVAADEFTYLCVLLMLALLGPGLVSLDAALMRRRLQRSEPAAQRLVPAKSAR